MNRDCPRCGRIVDDGAFCNLCGMPFSAPPPHDPYAANQWPPPPRPTAASYGHQATGYPQTNHTRYLANAHRIYGGCSAVIIIGTFLFTLAVALTLRVAWPLYLEGLARQTVGIKLSLVKYGDVTVFILSLFFVLLMNLAFTVPFFAVARGLSRQRAWTKVVALLTVLLAILVFPFGTALSVYTMWYFLAGPGRADVLPPV
jgi:hypothetical protein